MSDNVYDVLSQDFADFAAEEMEFEDRAPVKMLFHGQEFAGIVLGFNSSRSTTGDHKGHVPGALPTPGRRCPVCRWAEVVIVKTDLVPNGEPLYAAITLGKSAVPDDEVRVRDTWTPRPLGVLEGLMVSNRNGDDDASERSVSRRIPMPNAIAFRYAAEVDKGIADVLEEYDDAIPDFRDLAAGIRPRL